MALEGDLQQRELLPIYTVFPFNFNETNAPAKVVIFLDIVDGLTLR